MIPQTTSTPRFRFLGRHARPTGDGPAMARLRSLAGHPAPDPAGEGLRLARRRALEDAHLAWRRGDAAGEAVLRAVADGLGRELAARLVRV
jgi:hypothetical protein